MKESTLVDMGKKTLNALERLDALEKAVVGLLNVSNKEFGNIHGQLSATADIVNALTDITGQPVVEAQLEKRATAALKQDQEAIDAGLLEGRLTPATEVGPNTVLGYKETMPNGKERVPGKFFKNFGNINSEAQQLLTGKKIGDVVSVGETKVEVLEVFNLVPPSPPVEVTPAPPALAAVPPLPEGEVKAQQ
jgi:hypothetical protein